MVRGRVADEDGQEGGVGAIGEAEGETSVLDDPVNEEKATHEFDVAEGGVVWDS